MQAFIKILRRLPHRPAIPLRRPLCTPHASSASAPTPPPPSTPITSHLKPAYTLPHYGAPDSLLASLSEIQVRQCLRSYGGLIRDKDDVSVLRTRLRKLTRADYGVKQLTMKGVVTSDKMQKSVVVAVKRPAYSTKLKKRFFKTKRFMAHDEFDLCREGDQVVIRNCRLMSRRKAFVVVENYGDRKWVGEDERAMRLKEKVEMLE